MVNMRDASAATGSGSGGAGASSTTALPDADNLTSPTNLRKLVLNYLVHHCYTDTAHALARDGVEMGGAGAVASASGSTCGSSRPQGLPQYKRSDSWKEVEVNSLLSVARPPGSTREQSHAERDEDTDATMHDGDAASGTNSGSGSRSGKRAVKGAQDTNGGTVGSSTGGGFGELTARQLQTIRIRRDIRDHILHGRIRHAIDLLNMHFPTVLNGTSDASVPGPSRGTTAYARWQEAEADKAARDRRDEKGTYNGYLPDYPTSLDPSHLFLNLQIQLFIEMLRSSSSSSSSTTSPSMAGLSSSQSFEMTPATSSNNGLPVLPSLATSTPGIVSASRAASPAPSSASSTGSAASSTTTALNPTLAHALQHAQTLFARVAKLPVKSRVLYMKELDDVTGLLAYKDIERSPLASFLSTPRKMALAEQINSAIMYSLGQPSQPLLESVVRQTTFVWRQLSSDKAQLPHGTLAPSASGGIGVLVTGGSSGGGMSGSGAMGSKGRDIGSSSRDKKSSSYTKYANAWDFHTFLSEQ